MDTFPVEFFDLLSPEIRRLVDDGALPQFTTPHWTPVAVMQDVMPTSRAADCVALLEASLLPHLKLMEKPIPADSISGMTENYSEKLAKTVRVRSAMLAPSKSKAAGIAHEIGLTQMLQSDSLWQFAQAISGRKLLREVSCQAICYGRGDYSGPHNDHHPEEDHLRNGYVDVHIMFNTEGVYSQWLVYEQSGYLSEAVELNSASGVSVYLLPFWHYTTPLIAKIGREADARRWLLLSSFVLA